MMRPILWRQVCDIRRRFVSSCHLHCAEKNLQDDVEKAMGSRRALTPAYPHVYPRPVGAASSNPPVDGTPDHIAIRRSPARFGIEVHDDQLAMDAVPLATIANAVGTPAYIYSSAHIEARYRALDQALAGRPHLLCYAVKANSSQAVLRLLANLGAGADIVSGGEMQRALAAGIPGSKIVFSGVGKSDAEIDAALTTPIKAIHIESAEELVRVEGRAKALGRVAPIGLRVNPDIDPDTHPYLATGLRDSKFGITMGRAVELALKSAQSPHLELEAITCHIGSQIMDAGPFLDSFERLRGLLDSLRDHGVCPRTLDLGGGMGIAYSGDESPVDITAFGQKIVQATKSLDMQLVLEPGRFLVGNAGVLLTRVIGRKRGETRSFVIVDAAMNDLLRPALYAARHPIVPTQLPPDQAPLERVDIVGPVCECGDFLAEQRLLPRVDRGDLLAVCGAGAYGMTMASTYNTRPLAPEVLVRGGEFAVTRPRKTVADLIAEEVLPPWLK